jgi:hypothetical protein
MLEPGDPAIPKPKKPRGLKEAGTDLWDSVSSKYRLRPDEWRILIDAAREADLVARLEDELVDAPLMVKGSQGQLVASPLVSEVRQHRAVLAQLLGKLKLPDSPQESARKKAEVSEKARMAARVRWGSGTKGA